LHHHPSVTLSCAEQHRGPATQVEQSPLILAARNKCDDEDALKRRTEVVQLLVDAGSDVNTPDKYGDPPLILAVMDGTGIEKCDVVRVLVDAGAKLDCQCANFKMNPLHWAAVGAHCKIAALLMERASAQGDKCKDLMTMKDGQKRTPLQLAKKQKSIETKLDKEKEKHDEVIALLETATAA